MPGGTFATTSWTGFICRRSVGQGHQLNPVRDENTLRIETDGEQVSGTHWAGE